MYPFFPVNGLQQTSVLARYVQVDEYVVQAREQPLGHLAVQGFLDKGLQGVTHLGNKLVVVDLVPGHADDPGFLVQQSRLFQLVDGGQQLAPGEIPQHPEDGEVAGSVIACHFASVVPLSWIGEKRMPFSGSRCQRSLTGKGSTCQIFLL